jgi:ADP-ribose pyrophosphatase YjhB (NUDIX family)
MDQVLTFERPLTTVDLAIFAIGGSDLSVLLVQRPSAGDEPYPGQWALPGGFVDVHKDASLEACALRKLQEKTGVEAPYLEQLGSWGGSTRDPRGWSATHVYVALLGTPAGRVSAGGNAQDVRWWPVSERGRKETLAFDHSEILEAAVTRLRNKVEYTSLPAFLMPPEFTLTELQKTYETVLGRPLEKKAFRTRMLATELLEKVPRMKEGRSRPAQLYRLKHRRKPVFFARTFGPG